MDDAFGSYVLAIQLDFHCCRGLLPRALWRWQHAVRGHPVTIPEALDIVVGRTGVERYRFLCSSANTLPAPNDPATWQQWIIDEAERDPTLPEIPPELMAEMMREANQWPPPVKPCGGCP